MCNLIKIKSATTEKSFAKIRKINLEMELKLVYCFCVFYVLILTENLIWNNAFKAKW
jgi:hypothetical protein